MITNDNLDEHLKTLIEKYIANTCSREEFDEFKSLVNNEKEDAKVQEFCEVYWGNPPVFDSAEAANWDSKFYTLPGVAKEINSAPSFLHRRKRSLTWLRISVAASVLLVLGIGTYVVLNKVLKTNRSNIADTHYKNDVLPGKNKAILTLANGKQIILDGTNSDTLAMQGFVNIIKRKDDQLVYETTDKHRQAAKTETTYNTLTNPRGSKVISLTLADGSKVWLNAESFLKYPTDFIGNEREVEISGEAYFEVAHNAAMPFKVKKDDAEVVVLGTHFNINSYDNEASLKTTLVEGSVKVNKGNETIILKPGEQAQIMNSGKIILNKNVDVDEVLAWKNGFFEFENMDLPDIMRQVERWYDVSVTYTHSNNNEKFGGRISRNLSLSSILNLLETNGVRFKLEGKKITVF